MRGSKRQIYNVVGRLTLDFQRTREREREGWGKKWKMGRRKRRNVDTTEVYRFGYGSVATRGWVSSNTVTYTVRNKAD